MKKIMLLMSVLSIVKYHVSFVFPIMTPINAQIFSMFALRLFGIRANMA